MPKPKRPKARPSAAPGRSKPAKKKAQKTTRRKKKSARSRAWASLAIIEERIGYRFKSKDLLAQALTHRSYSQEASPPEEDNERLEFLGDAVLQLIVTERLWKEFPEASEGSLTRLRSERVNGRALARVFRQIDFGEFLLLGKGEEKTGGRKKPSIQAGAFEALVGAVYLDTGYARCAVWVESWIWRDEAGAGEKESGDFKGQLQELIQRQGDRPPVYHLIKESGPEHSKTFEIEVRRGKTILGKGKGTTKKAAEQEAAARALRKLGTRSGA